MQVGSRALVVAIVAATLAVVPAGASAQDANPGAPESIFLLTDSVVLGAVDELEDAIDVPFKAIGFPGFHLYAAPQVFAEHSATNYDTVIVAIGNNEDTSTATMRRRVTEIMEALRPVKQVIWVRPRHWASRMVQFNAVLSEAHLRWANLELADWQSVSAGHGEFVYRDGIHLTPTGQDAITALIMAHVRGEVAQDRPTIGNLDSVRSTAQGLRVGGWAIDLDTNNPVDITFTLNGKTLQTATANTSRTDVDRIWNHGPNHGYALTIGRIRDGNHTLCATARDTNNNPTPLGCKTVTHTHQPAGQLELIRTIRGRIQVQGWAHDPDTNGPVWIRIRGNKQRFVNSIATRPRPDIETLTQLPTDQHGFRFTIPIPSHIPTDAKFCVWAIDSHNQRNTKLGCLAGS